MEQFIISVGREFGSGGRHIAEELGKRFNIPVYNRHLITEIAENTYCIADGTSFKVNIAHIIDTTGISEIIIDEKALVVSFMPYVSNKKYSTG